MTGCRILLLEDHDDTRRVLGRLLRTLGHDVIECATSDEAVAHVEGCGADVALLDVRLPGRSGDDFGRELRQRCPSVRIIFITGEADIARLKDFVPDSYVLRKPVDVPTLAGMIANF